MSVRDQAVRIAEEIARTVGEVDDDRATALVAALDDAERVFLAGAGRSRRSIESFAIRLELIDREPRYLPYHRNV